MKELVGLTFLLVAAALIVITIHLVMVSYQKDHPTYIYQYEDPEPAPTYFDPASNYSSYSSNSGGWGYYPVGNTSYPVIPVTPTLAASMGGYKTK